MTSRVSPSSPGIQGQVRGVLSWESPWEGRGELPGNCAKLETYFRRSAFRGDSYRHPVLPTFQVIILGVQPLFYRVTRWKRVDPRETGYLRAGSAL